jgi:hypothetical protein
VARIEAHKKGEGSPLIKAVVEAGISFHVAQIIPGKNFKFEKTIKAYKNTRRLCPICRGEMLV